jgi:hypothetical protein
MFVMFWLLDHCKNGKLEFLQKIIIELLSILDLSNDIDFGQKWLGFSMFSSGYFAEIKPIFDKLAEVKNCE